MTGQRDPNRRRRPGAHADRFASALVGTAPNVRRGEELGDTTRYGYGCFHCNTYHTDPDGTLHHHPDCPWANAHHWLGRPLPPHHTGGTP